MRAAFGFPLKAEEAYRIGLAQWLVPHDALMARAMEVAEHIASLPPLAARLTKESLNRGIDVPLADAVLGDLYRFAMLELTEDKQEAHQAWRERRKPKLQGTLNTRRPLTQGGHAAARSRRRRRSVAARQADLAATSSCRPPSPAMSPSASPRSRSTAARSIARCRSPTRARAPAGTSPASSRSRARTRSGPPVGTRVVGMLPTGAWAERIRAPSHAVAALPDGVTDAQAATLPVAGLTALHALRQGGLLLGRKVLVDGATGGVGHLAVQLAATAGAEVYGHVRRAEQAAMISEWCGDRVIVAADLRAAASSGPYHLILDSIGGSALSAALTMLQPNGTCVHFGVSEAPTTTFESGAFFRQGGVKLYGLILFHELRQVEPAGQGLAVLAREVALGRLRPHIEIEAPWTDIAGIARRLIAREFAGKAVLHVS